MSDYRPLFQGKKITVMGLGLLGRGVGDAAYLAQCGAQVLVTDMKTAEQLADSVAQLKQYPNITFHLGGHDEKDFTDADMVLKAAGVRLDSPYIGAARAAGVPVVMSTALFAKYAMEAGATIVGITGTRGKSTVTQMIYHVLQIGCNGHHCTKGAMVPIAPDAPRGRRVFLGGNVRGISTLAMLPDVRAGDITVLELDSWQLQGFGDLRISPHIAVFTNLLPDHQNYYKDMDEYFADKANIFRFQKDGDVLIVGEQVADRVKAVHKSDLCTLYTSLTCVPPPLPDDWTLCIPGMHNRQNAALAAAALRALGLDDSAIKEGLESFEGVEGRLQFVREVRGVKIYNDNNATTPDATIAALKALDVGARNIILIIGGADKGLDMSGLRSAVHASCKQVIFLAGTGTDRIHVDAPDAPVFNSIDSAVEAAMKASVSGDIVLFSPAFASFGMFKNEYDRNDQFMKIVQALQ